MHPAQPRPGHQFSVLSRFGVTFAAVGGILLALSSFSALSLLRTRSVVADAAHRDVHLLRTAEQLLGSFYKMQIAEQDYLDYADDRFLRAFQRTYGEMRGQLDRLRAAAPAQEQTRFARIDTLCAGYLDSFARRREALRAAAPAQARALLAAEDRLLADLEEQLTVVVNDRVREDMAKLEDMSVRMMETAGLVLATLIIALSGLALTYFIGHGVARRLRRLSAGIDAIGRGDGVAGTVPADGRDEIGHLAAAFNDLQRRVAERSAELERSYAAIDIANRGKSELLANMSEGLVTLNLDGTMSEERSAALSAWLGPHRQGVPFWEHVAPADRRAGALFRLGWEALTADVLPLELALDQMPRRITVGAHFLHIGYKPILVGEALTKVMLVISDITSQVAREKLEAEQRELLATMERLLHHPGAFREFLHEAGELVRMLSPAEQRPVEELHRLLHTLKGNAGSYGLSSISSLCHDAETRLRERGELRDQDREEIALRWRTLAARFERLMNSGGPQRVEIGIAEAELEAVMERVRDGAARPQLLRMLAGFRLQPTRLRLEQLAELSRDLSRKLDKGPIQVTVEDNDLRISAPRWGSLFSVLTHVIRNAVDHGLEPPDERRRAGKGPAGTLRLRTFLSGDHFVIEAADDGRGIDWERLAQRARERGLPADSRDDLMEALFTGGVSTREEITEHSGRGIGMSAVREACAALGGVVRLASEPGAGTALQLRFPAHAMGPPEEEPLQGMFSSLPPRTSSPHPGGAPL